VKVSGPDVGIVRAQAFINQKKRFIGAQKYGALFYIITSVVFCVKIFTSI